MEYTKLAVEEDAGCLVATINNPPANALGQAVLADLVRLLDDGMRDSIRALVIVGSGAKVFSAGADIREFAGYQSGQVPEIYGADVFWRIEHYPKPVIAAMQGGAFGGGLELALSCHLRVMSASASVGLPEVRLGILPGWGGTQRLPRLIGKTRAVEMILTGDSLSADQALAYGLVNRVAPQESVVPEARALASRLARGAPIAIREILKVITRGLETTIEEGLACEKAGGQLLFTTEDSREGARAFFEKRQAQFTGR